jgi:hypothetical protein
MIASGAAAGNIGVFKTYYVFLLQNLTPPSFARNILRLLDLRYCSSVQPVCKLLCGKNVIIAFVDPAFSCRRKAREADTRLLHRVTQSDCTLIFK